MRHKGVCKEEKKGGKFVQNPPEKQVIPQKLLADSRSAGNTGGFKFPLKYWGINSARNSQLPRFHPATPHYIYHTPHIHTFIFSISSSFSPFPLLLLHWSHFFLILLLLPNILLHWFLFYSYYWSSNSSSLIPLILLLISNSLHWFRFF